MTESVSVTVGGVAGAERGVNKERVNSRKRRVEVCLCEYDEVSPPMHFLMLQWFHLSLPFFLT